MADFTCQLFVIIHLVILLLNVQFTDTNFYLFLQTFTTNISEKSSRQCLRSTDIKPTEELPKPIWSPHQNTLFIMIVVSKKVIVHFHRIGY